MIEFHVTCHQYLHVSFKHSQKDFRVLVGISICDSELHFFFGFLCIPSFAENNISELKFNLVLHGCSCIDLAFFPFVLIVFKFSLCFQSSSNPSCPS